MCHSKYCNADGRRQLGTIWEVPDELWDRISALLPEEKPRGARGRPPIPNRRIFNGILFVLRTGCQWKAVPRVYGSGSTVHERFQQWRRLGVMDEIMQALLVWYDEVLGIDWAWQSGDTKMVPAPLGGDATGRNPTDRGKCGSKRHLIIDGRGVPLSLHLSGANRHDMKGLAPLLTTGWLIARPSPSIKEQHLCLDKGYDYLSIDELVSDLGYHAHIRRRGEPGPTGIGEPVHPARRWKVERSISWLNNMRKLRVRWEKKSANYRALWLLAASLLVFRFVFSG